MTGLRDKIAVEPLDAERVARVERDVMTAYAQLEPAVSPPSRWLRRLALPGLAVAAAATIALVTWRTARNTAAFAADLSWPTHIITTDTPSRLKLNGSSINVGARTVIDLMHDDARTTIVLRSGRVDCEVEPRPNRPPFVVKAADVRVTVVGTIFSVERHGDDVSVTVTRGKVQVTRDNRDDEPALVAANEQWSASTGKVTVVASRRNHGAKRSDRDQPTLHGKPRLGTHKTTVPRIANHKTRRHNVRRNNNTPGKTPGTTTAEKLLRQTAQLPKPMAITVRSAFDVMVKHKADKERALYSLAYVALLRRGDTRTALEATRYYLRQFVGGTHYRGVLQLRVTALCKRGVSSRCRSAAYAYLEKFGGSGGFADVADEIVNH